MRLVASKNEAADDVLLEAMWIGDDREQHIASARWCDGRRSVAWVAWSSDIIPSRKYCKRKSWEKIRIFHHARRMRPKRPAGNAACRDETDRAGPAGEAGIRAMRKPSRIGRSDFQSRHGNAGGAGAMGRNGDQGAAAGAREEGGRAGTKARRHEGTKGRIRTEYRRPSPRDGDPSSLRASVPSCLGAFVPSPSYVQLMAERPEIETAVARAMDVHRGRHGPDLLRAGLLLCDWPGSKTLAILNTSQAWRAKPDGPPAAADRPLSEHVEAFLLAVSHGQLRSHFGTSFPTSKRLRCSMRCCARHTGSKITPADVHAQVSRGTW